MPADTRVDVDADLVAALRQQAVDAAEQLVKRYGDEVYRLALRITGVSEDAEAAASNALWAAARWIAMFESGSIFRPWIHRIAAASAYQKLRERRPTAGEIAPDDVLPSLGADGHFGPMDDRSSLVDDGSGQDELHRVLNDALDALRADYRTALVLHDVESMSSHDIAATLGISPAEVKSRVHRSRLFVRKRLSEYLGSVHASL